MSKKNLLEEATIRRFATLAGIPVLREMGMGMHKRDEEEDLEEEISKRKLLKRKISKRKLLKRKPLRKNLSKKNSKRKTLWQSRTSPVMFLKRSPWVMKVSAVRRSRS